ncbi:MAG: hypothetical protein HGA86_01720, partial [Anaerolineaceae bacterium]|nr:hypothetical protein [Anaerolineaceae bacterium]
DLTGARDDLEVPIALNLPAGMTIVGDQTVRVQVGIATIEGSITLNGLPLEVVGLDANMQAKISPKTVDVILSGPLPDLDRIKATDIKIRIDLTGLKAGTYKLTPDVQLVLPDLTVESILPASVEVIISPKGTVIP